MYEDEYINENFDFNDLPEKIDRKKYFGDITKIYKKNMSYVLEKVRNVMEDYLTKEAKRFYEIESLIKISNYFVNKKYPLGIQLSTSQLIGEKIKKEYEKLYSLDNTIWNLMDVYQQIYNDFKEFFETQREYFDLLRETTSNNYNIIKKEMNTLDEKIVQLNDEKSNK